MEQLEIEKIFAAHNAVVTNGHFVYAAGTHGSVYVNKDALYPHVEATKLLCGEMAMRFREKGIKVVLGPATGGIVLTQWVAYHLENLTGNKPHPVYAEKEVYELDPLPDGRKPYVETGRFIVKRGYDAFLPGARTLIVEDVLQSGGSVKKVIAAARAAGAEVAGVAALCNRGGVTKEDLDVPELEALLNVKLDAWAPEACPLCASGTPISTSIGHGKKAS